MNKFLWPLGLILIGIPGTSQTLALNSRNKSITEYIQLEESLSSKIVQGDGRYWSGKGIAQPIVFTRKQKNLPSQGSTAA